MADYIRHESERGNSYGPHISFACPDIRKDVALALRRPCEAMGTRATPFTLRRLQPIADDLLAHFREFDRLGNAEPSALVMEAACMEARGHINDSIAWLATGESRHPLLLFANGLRPTGNADKSSAERDRNCRVHEAIKRESQGELTSMDSAWRAKLKSIDVEIADSIRRYMVQEATTLMERRQGMLLSTYRTALSGFLRQ